MLEPHKTNAALGAVAEPICVGKPNQQIVSDMIILVVGVIFRRKLITVQMHQFLAASKNLVRETGDVPPSPKSPIRYFLV